MSTTTTSSRAKSRDPVALYPVSRRDGKPGPATFVHCIAASTSLPSAQNDPELGLLR